MISTWNFFFFPFDMPYENWVAQIFIVTHSTPRERNELECLWEYLVCVFKQLFSVRYSYPKILIHKFMLSFPPCLLLLQTLYKTHSNLKHISNPNQNENITHWKAIKESDFTHINRKKRQTLHTYTYTWRKTETL